MREYIITIAVAAIICALFDILAPKEWSKYIRVMIGFLILSVIAAPIATFRGSYIISPTPEYEITDEPFYDNIYNELKTNIESDIEARLLEEFSLKAKARVKIAVDDEYNIKGVEVIKIKASKNPAGMIERLEEVYGCDKIELTSE